MNDRAGYLKVKEKERAMNRGRPMDSSREDGGYRREQEWNVLCVFSAQALIEQGPDVRRLKRTDCISTWYNQGPSCRV